MTPLQPMTDHELRLEAEAALSDLARARGRFELVLAALPGRPVSSEFAARLAAISHETRGACTRLHRKADSVHRLAERTLAVTYGYAKDGDSE